jgi:putative salt-induced outer membrane protein YdiY
MKQFPYCTLLCSTLLFCATHVLADQVTMKNGDRLSGTILKYDGKNLVIKSEFAGPVTIPWDAVTALSSTAPIHVELKDGQTVVGVVTTTPDSKLQIATQTTGTVSAAHESVAAIRSEDEHKAYQAEIDRYRNPRLIDLWAGNLDLGFADSHGNSNTKTFTLSANAIRATPRDKISVFYTSIFASSDASGPSLTTANAKRGGIDYNLNFAKKLFAFGAVNLETDQFQSLDLRFVPAGGLGYHAIKSERTALDLEVGASADREFFSTGLNRTFAEVLLGEEFTHKFNKVSSIHERLVLYPNVSSIGDYRMNFDTSMVTVIRRFLSWQFSVSDRYLTNPIAGKKGNDVLFTTGFRLTFAK